MGGLIQPSPPQERDTHWRAVAIGLAMVVAVVGLIALLTRNPNAGRPAAPPPYVSNIKLSDLKMSAAENFVGGTVTYLDGNATNAGDKTVTQIIVQAVFKNSLGEVVQQEELPIRVLKSGGPYPDAVDLSLAPLLPQQTRSFRITLEHISADWNHQYPEMKVIHVALK